MKLRRALILCLAVVPAACTGDGGDDNTTAAAEEATTTRAEESGRGESFEDMPQECIDALVAYLQAIEPAVEGVDFESTTATDLEDLRAELDAVGEEYSAAIENLDCPEPGGSDEEAIAEILEIAEREAAGTVGYLQWVQGLTEGFGESGEVSGDCETDIAALQTIVGQGGTVTDLTMTQVVEVGSLVASVSTVCSPERAEEFFAREDVAAFLESQ